MIKKTVSSLLLLTSLVWASSTLAETRPANEPAIKEVQDLGSLGSLAHQRQTPILIMFSQKGCSYCVVLEEDYLKPMLKSGDYQDKVIIRKVRIDSFDTLRGFDGQPIEADEFAHKYRAYVTPTMVFLDHKGNELTRRLMGVGTEGYFANEIDQAIDHSLSRLRAVAFNN